MAETVEELSCNWEDDNGTLVTKELDKVILTKGAWATIVYLYQDVDRKTGDYGKPKARIQRYQKRNGTYRPHSKFNISSVAQGRKIAEILNGWADEEDA